MKLNNVLITLLFFISFAIKANEIKNLFDSANVSYSNEHYEKAIQLYDSIANKGFQAPELFFNLGNAYYKSDKIGLAILNYERARILKPDDEDINANLKMANQKIEDKIDVAPQLFLTEWKNGIVDLMTESNWSMFCILFIISSLILFALFFIAQNQIIKRVGFFGGLVFLAFTVSTFFLAKHKYNLTRTSSNAIVTSATVTVTGSPNEKGTKLFVLHEGTKVVINEEENNWTEIKIANGNVGWVPSKTITAI